MAVVSIQLIKNLRIQRYDMIEYSDEMVGQLTFSRVDNSTGIPSIKCVNLRTGLTQISGIPDPDNGIDAEFSVVFDVMGFEIVGKTNVDRSHILFSTPTLRANAIADAITGRKTDVCMRAAIPVDVNIQFLGNSLKSRAEADLSLGDYQGWVLYKEPTQEQLDSDSESPYNMWKPIVGDWADIPVLNSDLNNSIKSDRRPLSLPSGEKINRFDYVWSAFERIEDTFKQAKFLGSSDDVKFVFEDETSIDTTKLNVYVNGIFKQNPSVSIEKNRVDCSQMALNIGDTVALILKSYSPSDEELSFDPDTNKETDNPLKNTQYKYDYQYTTREVRNSDGVLINTLYYFWVANKNLATKNRKLSLQSAKSLLRKNTNPYVVLQNPIVPNTFDKPSYNHVIGVGLNKYITEDDTYKLRFTQDFALRDNPNDIDLKNVHTEWVKLREDQTDKIPEQLWNLLVDAACGQNLAGEPVPSLSHIAYDERNGTKTRFGFSDGQAFVDSTLAVASIKHTIANTSAVIVLPSNPGVEVPDPISFIDLNEIDFLFSSPSMIRKTLTEIWHEAKPKQINEIFFAVLYDALAENYEFTDIFKTSMIAAHSIRLFSSMGQ